MNKSMSGFFSSLSCYSFLHVVFLAGFAVPTAGNIGRVKELLELS
jgi:hypothetical protein